MVTYRKYQEGFLRKVTDLTNETSFILKYYGIILEIICYFLMDHEYNTTILINHMPLENQIMNILLGLIYFV